MGTLRAGATAEIGCAKGAAYEGFRFLEPQAAHQGDDDDDYRVQEFNLAHLYLVFAEIGDRTVGPKGGTTDYLIKRYGQYLFPMLWDEVNEIYRGPSPLPSSASLVS